MREAICGGGVIGACLAYYLSLDGADVSLIERHEIASAASGKSGGFLALDWCVVCGNFAVGHDTHDKNPVTCRAGLTTIEIIKEKDLVENAASVGSWALERLHDMMDCHACIGDVRGRGFLMGIDLVEDRSTKEPAKDLAEAVFYRCLENGLSFKISMGSVLTP